LVIDGGTLKYTGTGASTDRRFSIGVNGGAIDASGSGALNFSNTAATATTAVAGARTMTLTGTNTGDNKLAGVIADNGGAFSLTKDGTGKWILTGSNSYTGATTVTNGTLLADNSTGSATGNGVLTINGSAILGGFGIISGSTSDVTVNGTLAPGDPSVNGGIGTLTIGTSGTNRNTVLAEGSTFSIQTGAGENNCDKLVMFGGFDLSGSQTLALTGTLDGVSNYIIATYTGSLTGTFETVTGLGGYSVDYGILNAKAITLIVPEPGTFAMLLGGIGMLLGFRRSRKSRV
jgi:autotransporter-associated beta strand protein